MKNRLFKTILGLVCLVGISACGSQPISSSNQPNPSSEKQSESGPVSESVESDESVESQPSQPASESQPSQPASESQPARPSSESQPARPSSESKQAPASESSQQAPNSSDSSSSGGATSSSQSTVIPDDFKYNSYLTKHTEGQKAKYIFEAECTNLGGKEGPGYSGTASEEGMASSTAECGFVTFLYQEGMSVNFLIACDRDVNDAVLSLCVGAEFMKMIINPNNYEIRVDPMTGDFEEFLIPVDEGGILGYFDMFLELYGEVSETGGYIIDEWQCEKIEIDQEGVSDAGKFAEYKITTSLSLKRGINAISLITANSDSPHLGTMGAIAPCVDYISIETTAQLGMFDMQSNGQGDIGCYIKK